MNITDSIIYIGVDDREIDLFEGQYRVPEGMCYNSYVIIDEKIAVMDTAEGRFVDKWLSNLKAALEGRKPDYLVVQHMEPDHSAGIVRFTEEYPEAQIVSSAKAFAMMKNFFGRELTGITVGEGGSLPLGSRELKFVSAPMVHWPEVIVTYDPKDKVLFSADGFGRFGVYGYNGNWADAARRYYIGIVGKFGGPVQTLLKKASGLDIEKICPLHGNVLDSDLGYYIGLYDKWSKYEPEEKGTVIAYTSVYGNTKKAALLIADKLKEKGVTAVLYDLARDDMAECVADSFRYDSLILATTTYNGEIFPPMRQFISVLAEHSFKNRRVGIIENGTWAPAAARVMKSLLEKCAGISLCENTVTINSALNAESTAQLEALAEEISTG